MQGVEAAFSILFASDESDDGTWMQLLYEIQGLVDDAAIAKLLRMLWIDNSDNVDREVAIKMGWSDYTEEQLDQIAEHRLHILEKYRQTQGITRAELMNASDNYKKLTDDQAAEVLVRIANSTISSTMGAAYTGNFFVPTAFEKTIVDAEDVFAVGYTNDYKLQVDGQEVILCAVFTNDPYIPVFPMIYIGKLGFFEIMKSKKR